MTSASGCLKSKLKLNYKVDSIVPLTVVGVLDGDEQPINKAFFLRGHVNLIISLSSKGQP